MQLDHLLRSVLPVILLIAFGFWLQRRQFLPEAAVGGLTKLVSDYLIPCTIFTTFMGLDLRPEHFGLAACVFLIQLLLLGSGFLTARLFGFRRRFAPLEAEFLRYEAMGLARRTEQGWRLTPEGFLVSNTIIASLWEALGRDKLRRAEAAERGDFRVLP